MKLTFLSSLMLCCVMSPRSMRACGDTDGRSESEGIFNERRESKK